MNGFNYPRSFDKSKTKVAKKNATKAPSPKSKTTKSNKISQ